MKKKDMNKIMLAAQEWHEKHLEEYRIFKENKNADTGEWPCLYLYNKMEKAIPEGANKYLEEILAREDYNNAIIHKDEDSVFSEFIDNPNIYKEGDEIVKGMLPYTSDFIKNFSDDDTMMRCIAYWVLYEDGTIKIQRYILNQPYFQRGTFITRWLRKIIVKIIMNNSLRNLMVSKGEWQKEANNETDMEIAETMYSVLAQNNIKNRGRKMETSKLEDLLDKNISQQQLNVIADFVKNRQHDTDLACLLLALRKLEIIKDCSYTSFHRAIQRKFPNSGIKGHSRAQELYHNYIRKELSTDGMKHVENIINWLLREL